MARELVSRDLLFIGNELLSPRWALEQAKLRRAFPGMAICASGSRITSVQGSLRTSGGRTYHLRVVVPEEYPHAMPHMFISGLIADDNTKHMYNDGSICVMTKGQWSSSYSIAYMVARAAKWAGKYEIWKKTGRWPGRQQSH
jgi:hypothetical protein